MRAFFVLTRKIMNPTPILPFGLNYIVDTIKSFAPQPAQAFGEDYTGPTGSIPKVVIGEGPAYQEKQIYPQLYPASTSTTTPATTTTTPTNTTNTGSTGNTSGINLKDPNANPGPNYFWDSSDGWKLKDGGSSDINSEINKIYQDSINYLSGLEGNARNDYQASLDTTNQAYNLAETQSNDSYNQVLNSYNENQTDLEASKRSALSDAIRAYNALAQQSQSRFGGGSSAGEAVGELAKQEYFKQQGLTQQSYLKQERDIVNQKAALELQHKQFKDNLALEKQNNENELKRKLDTTLSQIQLQKNMTEQAKAEARISAIKESMNQARQIELAFTERAATVRESVYEKMAELDGNYNKLLELANQYESGQYFNTSNPYSNSNLMASASTGGNAYNYAYKNKSSDDDENPFN